MRFRHVLETDAKRQMREWSGSWIGSENWGGKWMWGTVLGRMIGRGFCELIKDLSKRRAGRGANRQKGMLEQMHTVPYIHTAWSFGWMLTTVSGTGR